jgi:cell division protein FtsB
MSLDDRPIGPVVYKSFIIVLTLIVIVLGVSYYNSNQDVIAKSQTIASLTNQLKTSMLENTALRSNVTSLTAERNTLRGQVSTLANETASLQSQLFRLNANMTILENEVESLSGQLDDLNAENINLSEHVSTLNNQVSTLQTQLSNQTAIVNMQKSLDLENDKHITIPANTASYLTYKTHFAGYTSGVYWEMGSNQVSDTYFGAYPRTGTTVTGNFKVPVMPGTTYIKIMNPSLTTDAVVYCYLTYIY